MENDVLLYIQAKKELDWYIPLSVSSTFYAFLLRIFSARGALPQ